MKKIYIYVLLITSLFFISCTAAFAADVYNEEELTILEAMGIGDESEVTGGYVMSLEKSKAMKLSQSQINQFVAVADTALVYRKINKHPFSGVCIVLETSSGEKPYFINSGVQVGKYGDSNYICYGTDEEIDVIGSIYSSFMSSENTYDHNVFTINESPDYLNFPAEQWAVEQVMYSAENSLLPFEINNCFGRAISRQEFCLLIGNLIAVSLNYSNLENYLRDTDVAYLTHYFNDTSDSYVNMLHALGVVGGVSETEFKPDDALTREQAAVILKNACQIIGISSYGKNNTAFGDMSQIESWALDSVSFIASNGIMSGTGGNFEPKGFITTEQAVTAVNNLFKISN